MIQADSEIATKTDTVNIYVVGSAAAMPTREEEMALENADDIPDTLQWWFG
jgi:hypothetical protein